METLLAIINWDWSQISAFAVNAGIGGVILAVIQGFFTRRKEVDDKEKVTFDTILLAQENLRKELGDRLLKAENQAISFLEKINAQEKEIYDLRMIIKEQEIKISHYENKISVYENKIVTYESEIILLKTRLTASGIQ